MGCIVEIITIFHGSGIYKWTIFHWLTLIDYGILMEWTYDGDTMGIGNQELG